MRTSAGLALLTAYVSSHGAVTNPRPRNSIDSTVAPWNGTVPDDPIPFNNPNWCEVPDASSKDPRHLSGANGQACFWFSNGCDYGCDKCDGETGERIPCCVDKFVYTGPGDPPSWSGEGISINKTWLATFNYSQARQIAEKLKRRKKTTFSPFVCEKCSFNLSSADNTRLPFRFVI
jgi:hypothetical protein